jgi:hypothetical protein
MKKKMTLKQKVLQRAKELNVEVIYGGIDGKFEVVLDAPEGKRFKGSELHSTVASRWDNESSQKLWQSALEDMAMGLEDCPGCEYEGVL